jgi:hypothetical protein
LASGDFSSAPPAISALTEMALLIDAARDDTLLHMKRIESAKSA